MNIYKDLANPKVIPLRRLVALTQDYYKSSQRTADKQSRYHRWYYCLANECERRGLDLDRIIKQ